MLFGSVMAFNTVVYLLALLKNDLSIVDITWGIMFLIPNCVVAYHRVVTLGQEANPIMKLTLALLAIWAVRLSLHIGLRHKGEDYRYKIIKSRWAHRSAPARYLCSYLYIFGMQGLFSMINNAACLHITQYSGEKSEIGPWEILGASVWLVGICFEIIGDMQLQSHRDDPKKAGTVLKTGLWRYTRHPNYFGECLLWWGFYLIACGQPGGARTFYSSLFITLLIRFVSGVAMLERKQKKKAAFRLYMLETNAFFPMTYSPVPEEKRAALLAEFTEAIDKEEKAKEAAKQKKAE